MKFPYGTPLFHVVFCFIDLVEGLPAHFIVEAVLERGSSRWFGLGMKIYSRNNSRIVELTADKHSHADKLLAIIKQREMAVGLKSVAEDIVRACREIPDPIYHDVIAEARRRWRPVQRSVETPTSPAPTVSGHAQSFLAKSLS